MKTPTASSEFRKQLISRLAVSKEHVVQHRDAMDQTMRELEEREVLFHEIADRIRNEVLRPTLAEFAEQFDNSELEDAMVGYCVRCQLRHSIRFPARAHISFRVSHNETIKSLTIQFEAHILPVFIRFDRSDVLDLSINEVDSEAVRQWVEQKVLGFLESYLEIETHTQYQRDNVALDPVCGMRVTRPKGIAHEHEEQTYYFCAQRCLDRFIQDPEGYVHTSSNLPG